MIPLFTWNESFLTNLPSVDEQHQRLVGLINNLGELVMSTEAIEPQAFAAIHDAILDYIKLHFGDEESQMVKSRLDPRHLDLHLAEHRSFLNEVVRLGELCEQGDSVLPEQARALVEYLVRWLAYHVLGTDQSMARQVRAIHDGQSPAQAFENDARVQTSGTDPLLTGMTGLFYVVSERNRELRILNRELEQRVQQRTIDLENANRRLQLLSTQDDLTRLPNRRFANMSLNQLWHEIKRYGGSLSVLMLDADNFKQVNDRFGHAAGDELLRALATRLREAVRRSDIVCRLGGDEFLVICPHSSRSEAANVARKILAAKQPFYTTDGVESWDGAISIGIADARDAMTQQEDLLQAADQALYTAKRQGGARIAGHDV